MSTDFIVHVTRGKDTLVALSDLTVKSRITERPASKGRTG